MVRRSPDYAARRDRFVEDLLAIMTMEEKVGQLVALPSPCAEDGRPSETMREKVRSGRVGSVICPCSPEEFTVLQRIAIEETRLGIPLLFAAEPSRGEAVVMPTPFALACTWRPEIHQSTARTVTAEARDRGHNWLLGPQVVLSDAVPPKDLPATFGASEMLARHNTTAMVRGIQIRQPDEYGALACLRVDHPSWHLGARNCMPGRRMRLLASVLRDANPASLALGKCGAVEAGGEREAEVTPVPIGWTRGYDGIDLAEWAEIATAAGLDVDGFPYSGLEIADVQAAVEAGRVTQRQVDDAVRRIIGAKFDLGLFQIDGLESVGEDHRIYDLAEARQVALSAARHAIVLMRNERALLPLAPYSGHLLVVGEAAASRSVSMGDHRAEGASLLDGLETLGLRHSYVPGLALRAHCGDQVEDDLIEGDRMAIGMATDAARRAGTVVFAMGDVGERCGPQRMLLEALLAANRNLILVTLGSAPRDPLIRGNRLPCVLHAGGLGTFSGQAIAEILSGAVAPSGRLAAPVFDSSGQGFALGHGLGYGEISLTESEVALGHDRVVVSARIENTGKVDGTETVQIYVRRPRPRGRTGNQLASFGQVTVRPGETRHIQFSIGGDELGEFDVGERFVVAPGDYRIGIGLSEARSDWTSVRISQQAADAMIRSLARGPLPAFFARLRQAS